MNRLPAILLVSLPLAMALASASAQAKEEYLVLNRQGADVFHVRFFDQGDGPFVPDNPPLSSTWNMSPQQKEKVRDALQYWADVITPRGGQLPAVVNVGTFGEPNAAGNSFMVSRDEFSLTTLQAALIGQSPGELAYGSHAQFLIGRLAFDTVPCAPSQTPRTAYTDLAGVAVHELAHGLGITNPVGDLRGSGTATPYFRPTFGTWTEHLRDDNGKPAQRGQVILCAGCNNTFDPEAFDVRQDRAYFAGAHVSEVLAGAMRGVPVKMLGDAGRVDDNYMSHTELKNSLMSHQNYRNYTTFMEAELAVLQDMGYQIDRRNFYGYSVYGDGQRLVNQHGYFQRNALGTDYIPGKYNEATLGLGLHVYGSENVIYQDADLLTRGDGGAGVRVDGQNNALSVGPGTRIYADGHNGRGVMFTYGSGHSLVVRGDVQALGEGGVAADFGFGHNLLGDDAEYRGSYIRDINFWGIPLLPELSGALVNDVDISGRLAGEFAAIYVSPNALVDRINVLSGARLEGNIYDDYDQRDADVQPRLTQLTFGLLADAQGRATDRADAGFRLRYDGSVMGAHSLALSARGGVTSLNGNLDVYGVDVAQGATLAGNGRYNVSPAGGFVNNGTVSPGNSLGQIVVTGDYLQGKTGQLLLEVDGKGGHDTFIVNGNAGLGGRLTFAALPDWYAADWGMSADDAMRAATRSGDFSAVTGQAISPTLTLGVTTQGGGEYRLAALRAANAYGQYGKDDNARRVGRALGAVVSHARAGMQELYRALDFSAADGRGVGGALSQLSPAGYSAVLASSLGREHQVTDILSARGANAAPAEGEEGVWHSFATSFGAGDLQRRQDDGVGYSSSRYGVVFGAERQSVARRQWAVGFHGAVSGQSVSVASPDDGAGKTTAFGLGGQARFAADPRSGAYFFGSGRMGVEDGQMARRVSVDDYSARHEARWTGLSGALAAGGGYRWAVNPGFSAGPLAGLDYVRLSRPGLNEAGDEGGRLTLESVAFDSLRSRMGVGGDWSAALSSGASVKAGLQLTWDRELRDTLLTQNAAFAGYGDEGFSSKSRVAGRDSLGVQGDVRYAIGEDAELGASLASEIFHSGYNSLSGDLSASWRF